MSDPSDINDRLEAAAVKAEGGSEIMRRFANDPAGAFIPTESGPLPSIKEWLEQQEAVVGELPNRVDDLEQFDADLASAASPTNGAAKIARGVQVVSSIANLRLLSKTAASKYAAVADPATGFFSFYRYDSSILSGGDIGVDQILAADGGYWVRLTNSRRSNVLYKELGAAIEKAGDRLFVGGAAAHNGTDVASQPDWMTEFMLSPAVGRTFAFMHTAQFAALNDNGGISGNTVVSGSQTKHFTGPGNAIALLGVAVNNNITQSYAGAYACYLEGFQMPDARGPCYGIELDVMNFRANVSTDPYLQSGYQVVGFQIAAGGENANIGAQVASTVGINFRNNGQVFRRGIVFGHNSIAGADGTTLAAFGEAMAFGLGHGMQWYGATGVQTSRIWCDAQTQSGGINQYFREGNVQFRSANSDKILLQVVSTASSVNWLQITSSATNAPPQLLVQGDDSNIDFSVVPKGTGLFRFGTYTAGTVAQAGYVPFKTSDGVTRKLLVGT